MAQNSVADFSAIAAAYITLSIQVPRIGNICSLRQNHMQLVVADGQLQKNSPPDLDAIAAAHITLSDEFSRMASYAAANLRFERIASMPSPRHIQDQLAAVNQQLQRSGLPNFDDIAAAYITLSVHIPRIGNVPSFQKNMNQLVAVKQRFQHIQDSLNLPDFNAMVAACATLSREVVLIENLALPVKNMNPNQQLVVVDRKLVGR
ncbi:hypothetical protein QBC46DRAFT_454726 [Diplogelasinospora grovesii]|uniref:Uncharacterized protein n=1 Tax=Diplogelasinospora grovesii TaxID=303347 RepID=A0AAN6MU88_9PEZI|nr:hypothetical protein QBC46DRAFT_454726 [Diplogelasinospora grovesii]